MLSRDACTATRSCGRHAMPMDHAASLRYTRVGGDVMDLSACV